MKTTHKLYPRILQMLESEQFRTYAAYAIGSLVVGGLLAAVIIGIGQVSHGHIYIQGTL